MCGGSGGQQQTLGQWSPDIAPWWQGQLSYAEDLKNKPYQQYGGQRIADLHPAQLSGFDRINTIANQGGTVLSKAGDDVSYRTLAGDYLPGGQSGNPYADQGNQFAAMRNPTANQGNEFGDPSNPWGHNPYENLITQTDRNNQAGQQNRFAYLSGNPFADNQTSTNRNQFSGIDNPAFKDLLRQGMGEITDAYQKGTAAETQKNFNLAGIFGGGAMQDAVANNQAALGKNLTNFASGMFNDQWNRSAGLEDTYLGRDLQSQQFDNQLGGNLWEQGMNRVTGVDEARLNRMTGAEENYLNRDLANQTSNKTIGGNWYQDLLGRSFQGQESQLGRANSDYEAMINRLYGSSASQLDRGNADYEAERQRQMGMVPYSGQQLQSALGLSNAQIGVGDAIRSFTQDHLNQGYGDWQDQQNYPYKMEDWFTGLLSRSMGGMSPSSTTTTSGYQASPFSQLLGTAMLGNQFFGK